MLNLIPRENEHKIAADIRLEAEDIVGSLVPRETVYKVVRVFRDGTLKSAIVHELVYELNVWTMVPPELRGLLFAWSTLKAAEEFVAATIFRYTWIGTYNLNQPFRIYEADAGGMIIHHDGEQRIFYIGDSVWGISGPLFPDMVLCEAIRLTREMKD